jgi:uncharacterized protein (TIGR02246 family)
LGDEIDVVFGPVTIEASGGASMFRRVVLLVTVTMLIIGGCSTGDDADEQATTTDPVRVETDRIVQAWIDGFIASDPDAIAALYAEDGTYADVGFPFEIDGRTGIFTMVANHLMTTIYTAVDPINVTYTDTGAIVEWLWAGTYKDEPFSMNPSTTFEIEDGLITRSTDSYDRSDAPW